MGCLLSKFTIWSNDSCLTRQHVIVFLDVHILLSSNVSRQLQKLMNTLDVAINIETVWFVHTKRA